MADSDLPAAVAHMSEVVEAVAPHLALPSKRLDLRLASRRLEEAGRGSDG